MAVMGKLNNNSHSSKNKKKLKFDKNGKKQFKLTGKRGRIIVRNLPFKCNENELHKHFKPYGEIKDIHLLRRPDNKLVGCGFVEYGSRLNADRAVEQLNGKPFLGRPIYIERAVARERYDQPSEETSKDTASPEQSFDNSDKNETETKKEPLSDEEVCVLDAPEIKKEDLSSDDEFESQDKQDRSSKTNDRISKNVKKGRLIVRNLSFKSTEDTLREHFSQFGEVTEVKLLRRPNNTLVGCGFVQFNKKLSAAKAIHHTSGKPFLDRPIIVDWAVGKDRFKKMQEEAIKKEIKKEEDTNDETKPLDISNVTKKSGEESDEESEESGSEEENKDEDDDDDDDEESNEDDIKPSIKQEIEDGWRKRSNDVDEGKTVFVKNLPFSVTNSEFQECMEQFGPLYYALVCRDSLTEHSKGSGFVKFKKKEDAEKCLSAGTELTLNGTILDPHPALKRTEVKQLMDKSKEKKDNRNLYLVKEGMIIAGTPAAKGVSVSDMQHRLQLEQWKTTKLRNLNMFVSRDRLVVHNLPATFTDKQLRRVFQRHTGHSAVITEARTMRDSKKVDAKGMGLSKGFGFVSFEKHEDALKALRNINNNPDIFTPTVRPIVSFSIENRSVLNTKAKRMIRSRQKNPLCKDYKPDETDDKPKKKIKLENEVKHEEENEPAFAGISVKRGAAVKMRQKYKLTNQAQQHIQDVRKEKHEAKMSRKNRRAEHIKKKQTERKTTKKNNKTLDNDSAFSSLVDKYKKKILSQVEKKKWYDK